MAVSSSTQRQFNAYCRFQEVRNMICPHWTATPPLSFKELGRDVFEQTSDIGGAAISALHPGSAPGRARVNPLGSTAPGLACFRTSQRSRKCSCEADRSERLDFRHLSTKAGGSISRGSRSYDVRETNPSYTMPAFNLHGPTGRNP